MRRSRRLLFVLSPSFPAEKSFSLLEGRLGLYLQHGHQASIVAVVYHSVSKVPSAEVAQLRQASVCTVKWRGNQSEPRRSRFWLRLQLALPVRPLALGRRLIDSTSSHSDLAALALQRAQQIQNCRGVTNQSHKNGINQSRRGRKALPKGRGSVRSEEGPQCSRRCSGYTGFMSQVENRWVETEVQQESCDRTNANPQTDTTQIPDPTHKTDWTLNHSPSTGSTPLSNQQDEAERPIQQQQLMSSSYLEETFSREKGRVCGEDGTNSAPI